MTVILLGFFLLIYLTCAVSFALTNTNPIVEGMDSINSPLKLACVTFSIFLFLIVAYPVYIGNLIKLKNEEV